MPNMDGIAMLEAIYNIDPKQKFIIVSAHKDEDLLIKSINLRVLGYFTKPLNVDNIMELLKKAKIDVLSEKQRYVEIDSIYRYNSTERLLYENDSIVKLSKKETEVLSILMHNKGKIVDVDRIKTEVWGTDDKLDTTLRTIIKRLKDKITKSNFILSRKGLGYMIE
jgi:DNA-binding response OmpR family regulator